MQYLEWRVASVLRNTATLLIWILKLAICIPVFLDMGLNWLLRRINDRRTPPWKKTLY